jgi:transcriptional regulator with GAF, ATPase, and Fis domain
VESELFGYERGAFTGAVTSKPGRFELAKGGTRKISLEAGVVAATNVDLEEGMRQGRFRDGLYYRLFTVPVHLPPLREKREDIPILVKYFLEKLNRKFNKKVRGVWTPRR